MSGKVVIGTFWEDREGALKDLDTKKARFPDVDFVLIESDKGYVVVTARQVAPQALNI